VKICVRRRAREVRKSGRFPNKCANRVTRRVPGRIEGVDKCVMREDESEWSPLYWAGWVVEEE